METAAGQLPKISVVIPVYNTEKYLEECVASVYRQEYEPKEVILVDDGSTDGSSVLCDILSEKYGLKVIHKKNGGPSAARNAGIGKATGKYIMFLDSDDLWLGDPQLLGRMIAQVEEIDNPAYFLLFGYRFFSGGGEGRRIGQNVAYDPELNKLPDKAHRLYALIARGQIHVSVCFRIVNLGFIRNTGLFFSEGMSVAEDTEWTMRLLGYAEDFRVTDEVLYAYRQNVSGSATATYPASKFYLVMQMIDDLTEKYHDASRDDKLSWCFMSYACVMLCGAVSNLRRCERKYHREFVRELEKRKFLCRYALHPNAVRTCRMMKIAGIGNTSRLLHSFMGIRRKMR